MLAQLAKRVPRPSAYNHKKFDGLINYAQKLATLLEAKSILVSPSTLQTTKRVSAGQ